MAFAGVAKIVRFNWPWYAGVLAIDVAAAIGLGTGVIAGPAAAWILASLVAANFWLIASLAVSHYVYDRSAVAKGTWLSSLDAIDTEARHTIIATNWKSSTNSDGRSRATDSCTA